MTRTVHIAAISLLVGACATRSKPQDVRDAYVQALRADDPQAAYALLAPKVHSTLSYEEFASRWAITKVERGFLLRSLGPSDYAPVVHRGTTIHPGGRIVEWTQAGDDYFVVSGLPGIPRTATPAQTIRAFIRAVRNTDLSGIETLMGKTLTRAFIRDWDGRVQAIEEALEQPERLELSDDRRRAVLHYHDQRSITLERTRGGWRIVGLE